MLVSEYTTGGGGLFPEVVSEGQGWSAAARKALVFNGQTGRLDAYRGFARGGSFILMKFYSESGRRDVQGARGGLGWLDGISTSSLGQARVRRVEGFRN